jgi:large subunit ribosomal protein L33
MGSQKQLIYLQNKETGEVYHTRKNKKLVERKLKYKKFSKKLRKHVIFEEVKKPSKIKKVSKHGVVKAKPKAETKAEKTPKK